MYQRKLVPLRYGCIPKVVKTIFLLEETAPKILDGLFCETPCVPCRGMVLIQEPNTKFNLEFSKSSTYNYQSCT